MPTASRLRSEQPCPAALEVTLVAFQNDGAVAEEADRLVRRLAAHGHRPQLRLLARDEPVADPLWPADRTPPDLVVVLGGDGSILRTARWLGYGQVPVLGINLGTLGFLADSAPEESATVLDELAAGRFRLVEHLMFETEVLRDTRTIHRELGLNETSILAGPPFSMIEIDLFVDGEPATTYRADGLIVSTPVGSTAYNLSAGGPIVRKDLDAFVFTPLSPHTLTTRPVVDSADRHYELEVADPNEGSACVVDGRVIAALQAGDRVRIRRAAPRFTLVETARHGYYRTLREKLGWGGGLRAARRRPSGGRS